MLKDKEKVLESVINEEKLTIKYGDKLNASPIGKKVRTLIKGSK